MREGWRFVRWVFIGVACSAQAYGSCYFCMPDSGQVTRSTMTYVIRGQFTNHCALPPTLRGIPVALFKEDSETPYAETLTDQFGAFIFRVEPQQSPRAEHVPSTLRVTGAGQTTTLRPDISDLSKEYAVTFSASCP